MIRRTKPLWRSRLTDLLLMVAVLLCPAVLRAQTNQLDFSETTEISAGTPGLTMTIFGLFPINRGIQTPMCFFTVPGTSGTPIIPLKGDFSSSTLVELQIPAGSIQEIPASAFDGGVFNATVYATANADDTCDGKIDPEYTNTLQIPIQEPAVLSTDLDTLTARNTNLSVNPAPREIYLQGTDFVPGEATATFSGSGFTPFAGVVSVVSPISARVDVPANLPAGAKFVDLKYCTHTATADYCASPVTYPIQPLANNPGTLTPTPTPTTPTTPTSLQAVFGSTDGFGVPSGMVTFTDGTTTLNSAPLKFTSGQFVATNPPSAAAGPFEGPPKSIVADLNHDGLPDVVLYAPNTIQIYYAADNLGGLGFAGSGFGFAGVEFVLDNDFCSSVVSVTTGDFNGDGYPDIAMLCIAPGGATDNVLVYLNQQDGTFGREAAAFPAPPAHLIAAADFDKDGNTDILLVGPDGNTDPNGGALTGFNIYPGDGFGDFGNSTPVDVPLADGRQVAAVDFNNDGFPDIALLYHNFNVDLSSSEIEVFQNDGKGNFPVTPTYKQALGDSGATFQFFTPTLPGSQYPNIVAVNGGDDASIAVVFNNQKPAIGFSDTIFVTPVPGLLTATMGDFDGDGFQDVAVYDDTNLSVYNAGPTGLYNKPIDSLTLSTSINLLVGSSDANGDGYSDPIAFITPSDGPRLVQQYITSGTATATLPNLTFAAGSHSLTATTPGTPTLAPGTATATLVSNGPTQIPVSNAVLTTSPTSPTTYAPSNPVTLTAEVDSANPPAPTGQISFFNAQTSTLLGTANLTATSSTKSNASLPIGTLTAGGYTFSATYPGDTTYLPTTLPSVTLIVNKATPVVAFVPNPATITFGTALSSAQLDATATLSGSPVAGSFVYTNASGTVVDTTTVLPGGSNAITATFTPSDTTDYKTPAGVTSTITVNKATPVVAFAPNPATLASGAPLTAAQLDATAIFGGSAVPGSFVYTNAGGTAVNVGTVLPAGANVITASFTPSNTTNFNVPAGVAATITLNAAITTLTFVPNPATITFGTALSGAQLDATATSGGTPVAGTFVYTNASGTVVNTTTILPAGSNAITVNFTPSDTTSFTTPAAVTSTITVNKATPTVSWTTPAAISFGTALSGTQLNATASFNGSPVAGTFSYNPAAGTVLTAGTHTLGVTFTPTDGADFNVATGSTSISVGQATPTITWATPAAISFGTALSATQLNATATFNGTAVAGTFSYNPAAGTVLTAGTHALGVTFTPTDTTDFAVATGSVNITVGQSTPIITWATPAAISFGTALSGTQLNATATFNSNPVAGSFSYNPASGTVLTAGTHTLGVTFTPTDTTDFAVATGSVNITVGQSTPIITWATPAAISYGTALSATQLNATATFNGTAVAGTFSYNPASGTVLTAGTHTLGVTFTPTDTTDFAVATGSVNITVGQSTPTITWPTPVAISYGTALSAIQLNATATFNGTAVAGTFTYNPAAGTILTAGTHSLGVTFTPTDGADFTTATGSVNITVGQSTPTITWATPAAISYGTALSGTQLNATATFNGTAVAGTFSYNPTSGTVLTAGTHTLGVTFTPTDTTDFTAATGSVSITVGQSTPIITWATPAAISYGTALSGTQLNATATFNGTAVAGAFSYNPASGTVLTAGSHTLGVSFTPTDTADFTVATGSTSIAVGQDTPVITWTPPAPINLGTALGAAQLNASATGVGGTALAGTFTYLPATGAVLPVGANSLGVTFTPADAVDYKIATASVPLTVNPALTTTTITLSANPAQFGQLVTFTVGVTSAYTGAAITGPVSVFDGQTLLGTVQLPNVTVSTSALSAGAHNITAVYGGSTSFGGSSSAVLTETISSATTVINWPQPASVPYGTKLSATQLNATVSTAFAQTVPGTFTYTPAAGALLTAGSQTLSVLFTPTDTASFKTATATVTLVVTKIAPTLNWATPANITAGTPLGATQLNATANDIGGNPLPGVFTYTPASGAILAPGATTLSAAFAPTDTVDYTTANISVPLNVDPAVATIAVTSTANPSQFGQPVTFNVNITSAYTATPISGTVTISDGKTVLGTPTLTNGAASFAISTLTAGAHSITASFAGNSTFAAATSPALAQTVNLATTTITWPTPAGISYGTALSATQLNATVATAYATTVPGTFVYTPAAGTLLTAGTQTLSVAFTPTDTVNFKPATGSVTIAVGKTAPTITWPTPADVVAGTVLSATQLNATATGISGALPGTFAYTPTLGTVLTAGTQNLSVTFTPTDLTDYTTATASVPLNVIGLALTSLSTGSVKLGDPALNLTLTGTGFLSNSVVYVGATALTTTFVNPTTLTVTIPASNFLTVQTLQITVNDPTQVQTSNSLALLVGAPAATVTVNGPSTVAPAAQPNLTFTVGSYAVPITATLTLTFTPAPGLTTDGTILFPNGTTTTTFTIPANTTNIPAVPFQSGSVAGTITIALKLTAGGVDVTPTPAPTLVITSPPAAPGVAGVTLDRSNDTLTVTIQGYSNTRDIQQIHFHFVAASGQSLATSDLVIDGSALFGAWYANPASPTYGSTFHYIQVFNLDQAATVVGQVQVTLVNSQGNSQTVSAQ